MTLTLKELKSAFNKKADFSIEDVGGRSALKITPKIKAMVGQEQKRINIYKEISISGEQLNYVTPGAGHVLGFDETITNKDGVAIIQSKSLHSNLWVGCIVEAISFKPLDYGRISFKDYMVWLLEWFERFTNLTSSEINEYYKDPYEAVVEETTNKRVAIFGIGGTGSHILDGLIKNKVKSISIYDKDIIEEKNLYRFPGNVPKGSVGSKKVDFFSKHYSDYGSKITPYDIDVNDIEIIENIDFAFISLDNLKARNKVAELLLTASIPFIVVGMHLDFEDNSQINFSSTCSVWLVNNREEYKQQNDVVDAYKLNTQIYEMNSLNSDLALIIFKKWTNFYNTDPNKFIRFNSNYLRLDNK